MPGKREQSGAWKEEYVRELFNSIVPCYDAMNGLMSWGLVGKWRRFAVEQTRLLPGEKALDVGTGTGEMAFLLARRTGKDGAVTALDFSEAMLKAAGEKARSYPDRIAWGKISFVKGDAHTLPFAAETFDCVTSAFVLRNVANLSLAIRELVRVCKPGGRVVCLEISEPRHPLLRLGFDLYFYGCIPLLGGLIGRGKSIAGRWPAYSWLACSLKSFPAGRELCALLRECGLGGVTSFPLSYGVVTVYAGVKPLDISRDPSPA